MAMNIYYTAKDIEEMAAKGIQQLELGPGVTLTDFARETAQQFNIALVNRRDQAVRPMPSPAQGTTARVSSKYNKPKGCQHAAPSFQAAIPSNQAVEGSNSNTVNRLIDLMGKVVKRGG